MAEMVETAAERAETMEEMVETMAEMVVVQEVELCEARSRRSPFRACTPCTAPLVRRRHMLHRCSSATPLFLHYSNIAPAPPGYCSSAAPILLQYCCGTALIFLQYYSSAAAVLPKHWCSISPLLLQPCSTAAAVLFQYFCSDTAVWGGTELFIQYTTLPAGGFLAVLCRMVAGSFLKPHGC